MIKIAICDDFRDVVAQVNEYLLEPVDTKDKI